MNNNRRVMITILDAARAELAERISKTQIQILREERWPHTKYFHTQNIAELRPLTEYLTEYEEAHAAVLKLLDEIDNAEAEDFGKEIAEYFRPPKRGK